MSVKSLMAWHTDWPQEVRDAPVWIDLGESAEKILRPSYLTSLLKSSDIDTLGVMLDADTSPKSRYDSIRHSCSGEFPDLPLTMPPEGAVSFNQFGKGLGIWIMPDNTADGCLETFLKYLLPANSSDVWGHACSSAKTAKDLGAAWREAHEPKVQLYTWLAWQDPPGQAPGTALAKSILDPTSESAKLFVAWFKKLYKLP
jgi:hypothetical protein